MRCQECNVPLLTWRRRKFCSPRCGRIHWQRVNRAYINRRTRERYQNDPVFRERRLTSDRRWRLKKKRKLTHIMVEGIEYRKCHGCDRCVLASEFSVYCESCVREHKRKRKEEAEERRRIFRHLLSPKKSITS